MATIKTYRWSFVGETAMNSKLTLNSPTLRLSRVDYDAESYIANLNLVAWETGSALKHGFVVAFPMGLSDDSQNESLSTAELAAVVQAVYTGATQTYPVLP
jgi:hypothetical protein